jgi:hypothetical protein
MYLRMAPSGRNIWYGKNVWYIHTMNCVDGNIIKHCLMHRMTLKYNIPNNYSVIGVKILQNGCEPCAPGT